MVAERHAVSRGGVPRLPLSLLMILGGAVLSCAGSRGATGDPRFAGNVTPAAGAADASDPPQQLAALPLGSLLIRKWRLANGLEIITVPDQGASAVTYLTIFRVGSRDEDGEAGETGLAHLFEHLMFTGELTGTNGGAALGEFDRRMEEAGGSSNATTHHDFTSYIDELAPQSLARIIPLEADRMVHLKLGPRQVANEREVVIEERLGSVDDSIDGTLEELLWGQAFKSHPYRWPIIGRMSDIRSISTERALAFYRRHYAPNRALVVVAGRFDEASVLELIRAAYGQLPPAPEMPATTAAPARERAPSTEVRLRVERPVPADRLAMGYPAPALGDVERAACDVLNEVLTGGPSSRLHRLLVVDRVLASSVMGDIADTRDPGLWSLWVQLTKGHDAASAEELILRELARVARDPVSPIELAAAKNRLESSFWEELSSSRGRAEALGHFDVATGDFRNLIARSTAYGGVTADQVVRAAQMFLTPGTRSVVVASPGKSP